MTMRRLESKVCVVTGGGSGIGRAICQRLAAEGGTVVVLELNGDDAAETVRLIEAEGGRAEALVCDIADRSAVERAFASIVESHGRVDVLVNNAGIAQIGNLETTTEADLDRVFRVNVKGVFFCMAAAVGPMVERGSGVILNMASIAANLGVADRFGYSMTKGAVQTMTFQVAKDYIAKGIRCNCINPARVHTPFVDGYLAQHYPGREPEMFEKLSAYQPIGRMAKPDEIAALAAYLCSDEAGFITGCACDIDGGVMRLR